MGNAGSHELTISYDAVLNRTNIEDESSDFGFYIDGDQTAVITEDTFQFM